MRSHERYPIDTEILCTLLDASTSVTELRSHSFNPFYPYRLAPQDHSRFSLLAQRDASALTNEVVASLKESSFACSLVGSAANGFANYFPYGCKQTQTSFGIYFTSTYPDSDADIEVIAEKQNMQKITNAFFEVCEKFRAEKVFNVPRNKISIAFFAFEDILKSLMKDQYPTFLVRYAIWTTTRIVYTGHNYVTTLQEAAKNRISHDHTVADYFWLSLLDRYRVAQMNLQIRKGTISEYFMGKSGLPTFYNPQILADESIQKANMIRFKS